MDCNREQISALSHNKYVCVHAWHVSGVGVCVVCAWCVHGVRESRLTYFFDTGPVRLTSILLASQCRWWLFSTQLIPVDSMQNLASLLARPPRGGGWSIKQASSGRTLHIYTNRSKHLPPHQAFHQRRWQGGYK